MGWKRIHRGQEVKSAEMLRVPHMQPSEEERWGTIFLESRTLETRRDLEFIALILSEEAVISLWSTEKADLECRSLGLQPNT